MPPPVTLVPVDGHDRPQNLPLNALAKACGLRYEDPAFGSVIAYLNGREKKGRGGAVPELGIRHIAWREAVEWLVTDGQEARVVQLRAEPAEWERLLVTMIDRKAARYRRDMPDVWLTPKALRDWWFRLERPARRGGLTAAEIAAGG